MSQFARDSDGRVYEWKNGRWQLYQETPGIAQSMAIGAGETFTRLGRGAADLAASTMSPVWQPAADYREELKRQTSQDRAIVDQLAEDRPLSVGAGRIAPYLATAPIGNLSIPGTMLLEGGLGAVEYGTPQERMIRGLFALGATGATMGIANRVARGINDAGQVARGKPAAGAFGGAAPVEPLQAAASQTGRVQQGILRDMFDIAGNPIKGAGAQSAAAREMLREGVELGIKFEPGMVSGNKLGRALYAGVKSKSLFMDIAQEEVEQVNKELYEKLALRALGDKADEFSPDVLARIYDRVDDQFDALTRKYPRLGGAQQLKQKLQSILDDADVDWRSTAKTDPEIARLSKAIDSIGEADTMNTKMFIRRRSALRNAQRTHARQGDSNAEEIASQAVEAMHEFLADNLNRPDLKKFFTNIQRYRLLKSIDRPGALGNDMKLSPGRVGSELRKNFKAEFWQNDRYGSLADYPDIDKFFKATRVFNSFPEIVGDSGTGTRQLLDSLLGNRESAIAQMFTRPMVRRWIKANQPTVEQLDAMQ